MRFSVLHLDYAAWTVDALTWGQDNAIAAFRKVAFALLALPNHHLHQLHKASIQIGYQVHSFVDPFGGTAFDKRVDG